jgi:hypothetical protein
MQVASFEIFTAVFVDESVLLGYDLTSLGEQFPTHFLRNFGKRLARDVTSYPRRTNLSIQDAQN